MKWHLAGLDTGSSNRCASVSVGRLLERARPRTGLAQSLQRITLPPSVSFHAADAVAILACLLVAGCGAKQLPPQIVRVVETVEVKVPVPVQRTPPAELLLPLKPPLPVFVSPESPDASSALTAEGERLLRGLIEELLTRIEAWQTWAQTPPEP